MAKKRGPRPNWEVGFSDSPYPVRIFATSEEDALWRVFGDSMRKKGVSEIVKVAQDKDPAASFFVVAYDNEKYDIVNGSLSCVKEFAVGRGTISEITEIRIVPLPKKQSSRRRQGVTKVSPLVTTPVTRPMRKRSSPQCQWCGKYYASDGACDCPESRE